MVTRPANSAIAPIIKIGIVVSSDTSLNDNPVMSRNSPVNGPIDVSNGLKFSPNSTKTAKLTTSRIPEGAGVNVGPFDKIIPLVI